MGSRRCSLRVEFRESRIRRKQKDTTRASKLIGSWIMAAAPSPAWVDTASLTATPAQPASLGRELQCLQCLFQALKPVTVGDGSGWQSGSGREVLDRLCASYIWPSAIELPDMGQGPLLMQGMAVLEPKILKSSYSSMALRTGRACLLCGSSG